MVRLSFFLALAVSSAAQIPLNGLVAYFPLAGDAVDAGPAHASGTVHGAVPTVNRFGRVGAALAFDGKAAYVEIPDRPELGIAKTGYFTISVWMRPDTLDFPHSEAEGYVHWVGKGEAGQHEWVLRMYSQATARPNRISCYAYNLSGGLGSGSYVQESVRAGEWIHIAAVYDFPANRIRIFKNGAPKDSDFFSDYSVVPAQGSAPVRIGTRDFASWFRGAVAEVRFYNRALTDGEIAALASESPVAILARTLPRTPGPSVANWYGPVFSTGSNRFRLADGREASGR